MPTYDYECPDCGHKFEEMQSISAKPLKKCPSCGKRRVKRLIGMGGGLIFKGSGFYLTDYARKGAGKSAEPKAGETKIEGKADAQPETKAAPKGDTDVDAKPANKPETKPETKPAKTSKPGK